MYALKMVKFLIKPAGDALLCAFQADYGKANDGFRNHSFYVEETATIKMAQSRYIGRHV